MFLDSKTIHGQYEKLFCPNKQAKDIYEILFVSEWIENPTATSIESVTSPIEDLPFPTVTICPTYPNPDRWGPVIRIFDYMKRRCKPNG